MKPTVKRPKVLRQAQLVASHNAAPGATSGGAEAEESDILWRQRSFFALDEHQEYQEYQEFQQYLPEVWETTPARTAGSATKRCEYSLIRSSIKRIYR